MLSILHPLCVTHASSLSSLVHVVRLLISRMAAFITSSQHELPAPTDEWQPDPDDADEDDVTAHMLVHMTQQVAHFFTPLELYVSDPLLLDLDVRAFTLLLESSYLSSTSESTHHVVALKYLLRHACSPDECTCVLSSVRWISVCPIYLRDALLRYSLDSQHAQSEKRVCKRQGQSRKHTTHVHTPGSA